MNNQEGIGFDDIRHLSEAFNHLKSKDFEHALISIKKISSKCDDLKQGKINKSNLKSRNIKDDDFKSHLQLIANKLKYILENVETFDSYQTVMLYNYALILHILQQNVHCLKILDKLEKNRSSMDDFIHLQFIWLRLDNYLNIQSPDLCLKLIENEFLKDEEKNMTDSNRTVFEVFQLKAYLQLNDLTSAFKTLEKCRKGEMSMLIQFLDAHILFCNKKLINSLQCLSSISLINDNVLERDLVYFWNNLGIIYFHLNKHNVGTMYFNRSLKYIENNKKNKSNTITNQEINLSCHYKIIHNLGIQLLFANKPVDAFDLFLEVVNVYPKNPRLWLRLAECCIKAFKVDQSDVDSKSKFVQNVIGNDKFKKVILDNEIKECKQAWNEVAAMPTPSLEFGSLCIRNALFLLPDHPEINEVNLELKNLSLIDWYKNQCIYVNPSGCIRGNEIIYLHSSLLLNGAYISLCLNNYVEAYKFCEKLLYQPILSHNHKYLARMYMSESMMMMNSFASINSLLNPKQEINICKDTVRFNLIFNLSSIFLDFSGSTNSKIAYLKLQWNKYLSFVNSTQTRLSNNPENPYDKESDHNIITVMPKSSNFPTSLEEAHSIMYYNWSVAYAIRHEDKPSEQCLIEAVKLDPKLKNSMAYVYLATYHDLRQGRTKNCLKMLGDICSNIPMINNIEV